MIVGIIVIIDTAIAASIPVDLVALLWLICSCCCDFVVFLLFFDIAVIPFVFVIGIVVVIVDVVPGIVVLSVVAVIDCLYFCVCFR